MGQGSIIDKTKRHHIDPRKAEAVEILSAGLKLRPWSAGLRRLAQKCPVEFTSLVEGGVNAPTRN
jgi:hypothetical protein